MLRRFLHFDSFLTSDLKNVKHVGFLNQMSEMNQNIVKMFIYKSFIFVILQLFTNE